MNISKTNKISKFRRFKPCTYLLLKKLLIITIRKNAIGKIALKDFRFLRFSLRRKKTVYTEARIMARLPILILNGIVAAIKHNKIVAISYFEMMFFKNPTN
ncbi:hypothetical protein [Olleya sp. Bg11-27]|uniref:hypothetical protein n=1 Tax=Olleya sp. Bg11-27 TaxID=2058135 RepID=UPI000C30D2B5|nr:hypothetical protein [Olleya sp. Bg11-27]AUC74747.1 hypothetical protein CW732_03255 [Olleya sp. Bg11-27]